MNEERDKAKKHRLLGKEKHWKHSKYSRKQPKLLSKYEVTNRDARRKKRGKERKKEKATSETKAEHKEHHTETS